MQETTSAARLDAREAARSAREKKIATVAGQPVKEKSATKGPPPAPRPTFESQREKVLQLLRDHADVWGATGTRDEAPSGADPADSWPVSPEYVQRFFGGGPEGKSHRLLNIVLRELAEVAPEAFRAVHALHLDPDSGDRDMEAARSRAERGSPAHRRQMIFYQWAVGALTARLFSPYSELTVELPPAQADTRSRKQTHTAIYRDLTLLRENHPDQRDSEHKALLAARYNVSTRTVERVIRERDPWPTRHGPAAPKD